MEKSQEAGHEAGFALFESLIFLVVFIVLACYAVDFFAAIHTGVVNSIAARTYLFDTLQHRVDIRALRQPGSSATGTRENIKYNYGYDHERFHAVADENQPASDTTFVPVPGRALTQVSSDNATRSQKAGETEGGSTGFLWIKTGYGICVDSQCAPDGG